MLLTGSQLYCTNGGVFSGEFPHTRGIFQILKLSFLLFNVTMSSIPLQSDVATIMYADEIAFYASDTDVYSLTEPFRDIWTC